MKNDSPKDTKLNWTGWWRAMLIGALIGMVAAAVLDRFAAPQTKPVPFAVTLHSKDEAQPDVTIYPSRVSAWMFCPVIGATGGLFVLLIRNNWRW